jgi:hypothetical protein
VVEHGPRETTYVGKERIPAVPPEQRVARPRRRASKQEDRNEGYTSSRARSLSTSMWMADSGGAGTGKNEGVISQGSLNKANRGRQIRALAGGARERAAPAEQRELDRPRRQERAGQAEDRDDEVLGAGSSEEKGMHSGSILTFRYVM